MMVSSVMRVHKHHCNEHFICTIWYGMELRKLTMMDNFSVAKYTTGGGEQDWLIEAPLQNR